MQREPSVEAQFLLTSTNLSLDKDLLTQQCFCLVQIAPRPDRAATTIPPHTPSRVNKPITTSTSNHPIRQLSSINMASFTDSPTQPPKKQKTAHHTNHSFSNPPDGSNHGIPQHSDLQAIVRQLRVIVDDTRCATETVTKLQKNGKDVGEFHATSTPTGGTFSLHFENEKNDVTHFLRVHATPTSSIEPPRMLIKASNKDGTTKSSYYSKETAGGMSFGVCKQRTPEFPFGFWPDVLFSPLPNSSMPTHPNDCLDELLRLIDPADTGMTFPHAFDPHPELTLVAAALLSAYATCKQPCVTHHLKRPHR